jgi:hypothetical protein
VELVLIGDELSKAGWRQGSIVRQSDNANIFAVMGCNEADNSVLLIVTSQSCDIAHNKTEDDPFIELLIASCIDASHVKYEDNSNPRILHTKIQLHTENNDIVKSQWLELKTFNRLQVQKNFFLNLTPNPNGQFASDALRAFIYWLAARYSRPALPTAFNERLRNARDKLRKKAKSTNVQLSGLYVRISPDKDIPKEERYSVNLLGVVSAGYDGKTDEAMEKLNEYAEIMRSANMDVVVKLKKENDISVATINTFKRFYYDDLSYRLGAPLPSELAI